MDKNCITCEHFAWWDGDYCCIDKMKILCESPRGIMTDDILISLEKNKNCKTWKEGNKYHIDLNMEAYNNFLSKRK